MLSPASLVQERLRPQRSFCNTWLKLLLRVQTSTRAFCRPILLWRALVVRRRSGTQDILTAPPLREHHRAVPKRLCPRSGFACVGFACVPTIRLFRRNNNSSRFGKFLTLQFSASGRMQGAYMKTYLLEKSRITSQLAGEQNYHVLYQVSSCSSRGTRAGGDCRSVSLRRSPRACQTT